MLALGTNLPLYAPLWHALPPLRTRASRSGCCRSRASALAALVAFAVARVPWRFAAVVAIPLVALDLRIDVYRPMGADEHNAVYAELRDSGPGRLLERPVIVPELQEGSVYLYYSMQAPRERPLGYSTTATRSADRTARALRRGLDPKTLGVRWVVRYRDGRPARLTVP